jgi:hypothetical protein
MSDGWEALKALGIWVLAVLLGIAVYGLIFKVIL